MKVEATSGVNRWGNPAYPYSGAWSSTKGESTLAGSLDMRTEEKHHVEEGKIKT